jgi:hypothetical protein
MAGTQERLMVLKMLEEKRISAREAEELLAALDRASGSHQNGTGPSEGTGPRPRHAPSQSEPAPELDLGDLGRGIRDAVHRFTEGLGKLAEGTARGEDLGSWIRDTLGTARVTVEKEIRVPAGTGLAARRVVFAGASGDVAVRSADVDQPWGTAFLTVWGPNELTARQSAEDMQVRVEARGDDLEISVGPGLTAEGGGAPGRPARWECRVDLSVPRASGVRISTASGDIRAAGIGADSSLSTASGDVALRSPAGSVKVRTASGDVTVRLAPDSGARIEAATASGEIAVRAPLTVERFTSTRLVGSSGAARWTIDVGTASGDIVIEAEPG